MEFMEINVPEGIVQQIDNERPFADIAFDVGNRNHLYPNLDVSYEGFMRYLPKKVLINNRSSWKMVDEINMERARYLLSNDKILEEKFGQK
jgi:hypothetical protein